MRPWEVWAFAAGVLIGLGGLFAAGWHFNHQASTPSAPTAAIPTTSQATGSGGTAAVRANVVTPTTMPCIPRGAVTGNATVGPDPSSPLSSLISGTVTNSRNDAIENGVIYLSIRDSSGSVDSSKTQLLPGVIPAGTSQAWSQPVNTTSGVAIVAVTITQITYADLGC